MFRQFKDINTSFRHIKLFSYVFIAACAFITCMALYKSFKAVSTMQGKIYILADGKVLEAYASERKANVPVEARDHVKTFHELFFTLDPDDKVIQSNITKALYLADFSAKREYDNLRESGYYAGIIAGNISQRIHVDSVIININSYPYYFRCYATEKIIRTTSIVTRNLETEGYLRDVSRSDNDPHGFLIERWRILANRDIKTEAVDK